MKKVKEGGNHSKGHHQRGQKGQRMNKGKGPGKGDKGRPKGKGKTNRPTLGNRNPETCSYCHKPGHQNRECRKRQYDEKQKSQTNNGQHVTHLQVDETELMFSQNVVFYATPYTDGSKDDLDNDETWVEQEDEDKNIDTEDEDYKEDPYGTAWQNNMHSALLAIRSHQPGNLKTRHAGPGQLHPTTEPTQTHLLVAALQPPAAKKTPPRGNPTTQVGHYPHPSMELPHSGGEIEDPTPLPSGPPSGPTNKLPEHSSPMKKEQQESSSVEPTDQDYSQQWGTGKFSPSWGNYTVPPPAPWESAQHPTWTQETENKNQKRHPRTSIAHAPCVRLQWPRFTPFSH
jgi:hypothetical protein